MHVLALLGPTAGHEFKTFQKISVYAHVQTGPGAHPASYIMGTRSYQGVNWPGLGVDNLPNLATKLKKE